MLKAIITGNLGNDPDMRYSEGGTPILRFNVASNSRVKDQDGEYRDRTEWVRVTMFGNRAESLSQYLKKGSRVYVDGRLEARPWTDQQGQLRAGLEMIGDTVDFMSPRDDSGGEDQQPRQSQERKPAAAAPTGAARGAGRAPAQQQRQQQRQQQPEEDYEDLPF